jgi:hypothetical protein
LVIRRVGNSRRAVRTANDKRLATSYLPSGELFRLVTAAC